MTMPWDRFKPEPAEPEPVEEPELPYNPPPLPEKRPIDYGEPPDWTPDADADVKALAKDLAKEALDYAKASLHEIGKGKTVDVLHPTVTVESQGKELVIADAKSRSWRTLVQGLIFDVFAAIVAAVAVLSGADPFVKETWVAFGILLLKSVVSAVISYFMRLRVTPTIKIPGETMALMPVPRPMIDEEWKEKSA